MDKKTENLLLNSTSYIRTVDYNNVQKQASCFFVHQIIDGKKRRFLVTNKHVLHNKKKAFIFLNYYHPSTQTYTYNNKIEITLNRAVKFHPLYDIAILDIDFLNTVNTTERQLSYTTIGTHIIPSDFEIFSKLQTVLMLGYPDGIYNETFNYPIARTGITATPMSKQLKNKDEFIVDIPSVGGASGSPIFTEVEDQLYLVGIVYAKYKRNIEVKGDSNRLYHKRKPHTVEIETQLSCAIRANQIAEAINSIFGSSK